MLGLTKSQMLEEFDKIWETNEELFVSQLQKSETIGQLLAIVAKDIMPSTLFLVMEMNNEAIEKQIDELVQKKVL